MNFPLSEDALMAIYMRLPMRIDPAGYKLMTGEANRPAPEPEEDVSAYLEGQPDIFGARRLRNISKSRIYVLPAELLTYIFLIVLRFSDQQLITHHQCAIASGHRRVPEESLFPVIFAMSHVCHHWYQLIANCPSMWKIIDINTCPSVVKMAIEMSKDAPLEVRMGFRGVLTQERRKWSLQQAARKSCRWVKAHFLAYIEELEGLRLSFVPKLEELYIVPVSQLESPGERPTGLFDFMPSLQRLHIGWWPGWDEKFIPNLRHLTICDAGPPKAGMSEIFRMLAGCPLLETLEMSVEVEIGGELAGPLPNLPSIKLPKLRQLAVGGWSVPQLAMFLRAVSVPLCRGFDLKASMGMEMILEADYRRIESSLAPGIRSWISETTVVEVTFVLNYARFDFRGRKADGRGFERKGSIELGGSTPWSHVVRWITEDLPEVNQLCTGVMFGDENLRGDYWHNSQVGDVVPWLLHLPNLRAVRFLPNLFLVDTVLTFVYGLPVRGSEARSYNPWSKLEEFVVAGCQCRYVDRILRVIDAAGTEHGKNSIMPYPSWCFLATRDDCADCESSRHSLLRAAMLAGCEVETGSIA